MLNPPIGFSGTGRVFKLCDFIFRYPFTKDQVVQTTDWEQFITEISNDILNEQSPKR
jgi:replication factor C subunit 3/5